MDVFLAPPTTTTLCPQRPAGRYLHIIVADVIPGIGSCRWRFWACLRRLLCTGEGELQDLWNAQPAGVQPSFEFGIGIIGDPIHELAVGGGMLEPH